MHAFSNAFSCKNLRTTAPDPARLESVSPRKSSFVLRFPQHKISQFRGRDHTSIRPRKREGAADGGRHQRALGRELEDPDRECDDKTHARDAARAWIVIAAQRDHSSSF